MALATIGRMLGLVPRKRQLEAAGGGRRWRNDRSGMADAASWTHAGAAIVAARAQSFVLNNPHGTRIVESLAGNLVGTGITPRPQHPSEFARSRLIANWTRWTDEADNEAFADLYGLQATAIRDMVIFGEALCGWTQDPVTGMPQLIRLHPEQLDRSKTLSLDDGQIVQGVEFGANGGVRAYWIRPKAPGSALSGLSLASQRFAEQRVIHMFRPLVPGQVRGLSWFAPVLLAAHELDQLLGR